MCTFACTTFAVALAAEQHKPSNITIIRNQIKLGIMVALFVLYEQALLIIQSCGWIIDTCDECVFENQLFQQTSLHKFFLWFSHCINFSYRKWWRLGWCLWTTDKQISRNYAMWRMNSNLLSFSQDITWVGLKSISRSIITLSLPSFRTDWYQTQIRLWFMV